MMFYVLQNPLVKGPTFQHFAVHHVYNFCTPGHDEFLILERAEMLCVWVGLVMSNRPFVGQQQTFGRVTLGFVSAEQRTFGLSPTAFVLRALLWHHMTHILHIWQGTVLGFTPMLLAFFMFVCRMPRLQYWLEENVETMRHGAEGTENAFFPIWA